MNRFFFKSSEEGYEICKVIVEEMKQLFGISESEAVGRINAHWSKIDVEIEEELLLYYSSSEWAHTIYYGQDSQWWKKDKSELVPLPYKD